EQARVGVIQVAALGGAKQLVHILAQRLAGGVRRRARAGEGGADMVGVDRVALGQKQNFADDVLQFADVAGPVLCPEKFNRVGMDGRVGDAQLSGMFAQEVFYQVGDVLFAVAQRWQRNDDDA